MVSPLTVPFRPTPKAICVLPPAVPKDALTNVTPPITETVPLVNVPANRVAPPADVTFNVPPVKHRPDAQDDNVPVVIETQPRAPWLREFVVTLRTDTS